MLVQEGPPAMQPVTLSPAAVPKLKIGELIVVLLVTPPTAKVNVAVPVMNGLWGPLPAIEPLALV